MTYVIVVGAADGSKTPHDGRYVKAWNPHVEFGTLELTSTANLAEAHQFTNVSEAMQQWKTVSRVEPTRTTDRQPNRPLMAVNIIIQP